MASILGWLSSLVLLATLAKQVHKQWRERRHEGVSKWLFRGQMAASIGFTVYSLLVREWIFVATNALILLSAIAGWLVNRRNRAIAARAPAAVRQPQAPTAPHSTPTPLPDPDFHRIPG